MSNLFIASDGTPGKYPKYFKLSEKKLSKISKDFSRKKRGSNRYLKQKMKLALIHEQISNQRKDFLHKLSTKLVLKYDLIAIEDLNMQEMSQKMNFGKSVFDNGWGLFTRMLAYKAEILGKTLYKVDKWFASSKTCSNCGKINQELKLSDRNWTCECGKNHDRDLNAANNILTYALNKTVGTTELARLNLTQ